MEYEYEYHIYNCEKCCSKFHVRITILRGFSDHEDIECPKCKTVVAKDVRCDMGYIYIEY